MAESTESHQQLLSKDLDTARCLRKDAEDKLENQSEQVNLWNRSFINVAKHLTAQAMVMGMDVPTFSLSQHEVLSANLGVFL